MTTTDTKVYRAVNGDIVYDGPPWASLSEADRTARIKDCQAIQHCSPVQLAAILKAFTPERKPNEPLIKKHIKSFNIAHPKVNRSEPRSTAKLRPMLPARYAGQKLGAPKRREERRSRKEYGQAIVAKIEKDSPMPESEMDRLKKQKGFCVALDRNDDYCGEEADGNLCEAHKNIKKIR